LCLITLGFSFYDQILPANSINLGLCFTAIHWLSEKIQGCKACVYFSKHASIEENNKYSEVSKKDLINFLHARSIEMKPGARLVFTISTTSETNRNCWEGLLLTHDRIMQEFLQEGKLTEKDIDDIASSCFLRPLGLIREVFDTYLDKYGLVEEKLDRIPGYCPHKYLLEKGEIDEYCTAVIAQIWAVIGTFTTIALTANKGEEVTKKLLEEYHKRFRDCVKADPYNHNSELYSFYVVLRKKL